MIFLNEAFREGQADLVMTKLSKVLSRRLHKEILLTTAPVAYRNVYGKFKGYFAGIKNSNKFLRFNFLLTSSDTITSVDFYKNFMAVAKNKPTFTVDMMDDNGTPLNIVQIVDTVINALMDFTDAIDESTLNERANNDSRYQQLFDMWVHDTPTAVADLQKKRIADAYTDYLQADTQYNGEVNFANFTKMAKAFLFGRGLTNPTFRKKKKGSKERVIEDQAKADELEDIVASTSWEDKFELLDLAVRSVINRQIQAVICWGSPGSGKSETVYKTMKDENVEYLALKGGVKNADELFNILKKHNDDEIIVMDDFDSAMKDTNCVNILKAALENRPKREIAYRKEIITFSSAIIFISNLVRFDTALLSRAFNVKIDLSNDDMLDKMEKTLKGFRPDVSMDMKKKALEFLKGLSKGVRSIDYRELEKVIIAMQVAPQKWEKFAILMIQSQE